MKNLKPWKNPEPRKIPNLIPNLMPALMVGLVVAVCGHGLAAAEVKPVAKTPDLDLEDAAVRYEADLDLVVFELKVAGEAGATRPSAAGQMHGAPVLAYVFPTTLKPEQVGFAPGEGTLALVATSHPDFDDTPLWDEDADGDTRNLGDGLIFHCHWVVLVSDERVPGGLAVKPVGDSAPEAVLPPTSPGMPIYLDSPGFSVVLRGDTLRIPVPSWRIRGLEDFRYDAVTAYLEVNLEDTTRPTLGVYEVYDVLSGDLSLPGAFELGQ